MYLLLSSCPLIEDLLNTDFLALFTSAEVICLWLTEIVGVVLSVEAPTRYAFRVSVIYNRPHCGPFFESEWLKVTASVGLLMELYGNCKTEECPIDMFHTASCLERTQGGLGCIGRPFSQLLCLAEQRVFELVLM